MRLYPPGPVTKMGSQRLLSLVEPLVLITSYDRQIQWCINGAMAPMAHVQEGAFLADGIEGMFPGFQNIGHKGARQNGISYQRTVYDEGEYELKVEFTVPPTPENPAIAASAMRRVIRDWIATWDPKHPPRMDIITPDMGRWWCTPRLHQKPSDKQFRAQQYRLRQVYTWSIVNEYSFWRGVDSISDFGATFTAATDGFNRPDNPQLGSQWQQTYLGPGEGTYGIDSPFSINEVQVVDIDGLPSSGTIKLSFDGPETGDININATEAEMVAALEALPTIGAGNVSVQKALINRFIVTFINDLGSQNLPQMGASGSFTGGLFPSVHVNTTFAGFIGFTNAGRSRWYESGDDEAEVRNRFLGINAVQTVSFNGEPDDGTFALIFDDERTAPIVRASSATAMQTALEALSTIGVGNVTVEGPNGGPWRVSFTGALGFSPQPLLGWTFTNEHKSLTINGGPSSGAFQLTIVAQQTAGIVHNPSAGAIQSALEALPAFVPGDLNVTGTAPVFDVEFTGAWGARDVPTMTATDTFNTGDVTIGQSTPGIGLTGGTNPRVAIAETVEGTGPETGSDLQVISVRLGELYSFNVTGNGYIDVLARWDGDDDNPTALRFRFGGGIPLLPVFGGQLIVSRLNNGVETPIHTRNLLISPLWWERWTFVVGTSQEKPRQYKVYRNSALVDTINESGTGSALGASYRHSGFGAKITTGIEGQKPPPSVDEFSVGDNVAIPQDGHLSLTNFGTEDGYVRYLCYGPGLFRIGDGPGSDKKIEFGPLLDGQIALLNTLPSLYGVVDLSPTQVELQDTNEFRDFMEKLVGLAVNNRVSSFLELFESAFGKLPPQGELYHLLKGRFTNPIDPKPVGAPPVTVRIPVEIIGGSVDSKIVAAVTPLRTWAE